MRVPLPAAVSLIAIVCTTIVIAPAHAATSPVSAVDRAFVRGAAASNKAEISSANVALTKGDGPTKKFARKMLADHTKLQKSLLKAAAQAKLSDTPTPTVGQSKALAALTKLSGSSFDHTYLKQQVTAHTATLALLEKETTGGANSVLIQAARAAMPIVKMHLTMAKNLVTNRP
jgi:putative membrane protein